MKRRFPYIGSVDVPMLAERKFAFEVILNILTVKLAMEGLRFVDSILLDRVETLT